MEEHFEVERDEVDVQKAVVGALGPMRTGPAVPLVLHCRRGTRPGWDRLVGKTRIKPRSSSELLELSYRKLEADDPPSENRRVMGSHAQES